MPFNLVYLVLPGKENRMLVAQKDMPKDDSSLLYRDPEDLFRYQNLKGDDTLGVMLLMNNGTFIENPQWKIMHKDKLGGLVSKFISPYYTPYNIPTYCSSGKI